MRCLVSFSLGTFFLCAAALAPAVPTDLTSQFELPPGFHIYRAATAELTGGSYALAFDGQGRLLVGDGNAVRRLADHDADGVYDSFAVLASGLGWRGPQGLLVLDDLLYAVGGDGIQIFSGYNSDQPLQHRERLGNTFSTGGDHDAHTILRGPDGWLYFMAGNGAGTRNRVHITEENSPCLAEREASVFRISPDGNRWECLATGGRNPPNLGFNSLGDLFSFDSDMEWHVGLPWYRPTRLNHWAIGGDQGWQDVGAYPSYFLDALPPVMEVGRGSPTWGTFYQHTQFPERYGDAFLVCDYRWKQESNDKYNTAGRLLAFFLQRREAGWSATMEVFARPKPGARDADGRPINFALVDCAVAPDGSLFVTDHNQGIWRIFFDGSSAASPVAAAAVVPPIVPAWPTLPQGHGAALKELLHLPQPASERSRLREAELKGVLGDRWQTDLETVAGSGAKPLRERLAAVRLVAPQFASFPATFLRSLTDDPSWEMRAQAAWLLGIRAATDNLAPLLKLLQDGDPFVRRRAAEGLTWLQSTAAIGPLIEHLNDESRLVRHVCMTALAHYPVAQWRERALDHAAPRVRIHALVAALQRGDPPADPVLHRIVTELLGGSAAYGVQEQLDLMRLLNLFQTSLAKDQTLHQAIAAYLLGNLPSDLNVRWEQVRLLGEFRVTNAVSLLLTALESEQDHVTQFHLAQSLGRLPSGWSAAEEQRIVEWFLSTQKGWFSELDSKGVEFPAFWQTVLGEFARHHRAALLRARTRVDLASLLGGPLLELLGDLPDSERVLTELYRSENRPEARVKIVSALQRKPGRQFSAFLREEFPGATNARLQGAILQALAAQPSDPLHTRFFVAGLRHDSPETARACAVALAGLQPALDESLAQTLVELIGARRGMIHAAERLLAGATGKQRPGYQAGAALDRRVEDSERAAAFAFWKDWFRVRFGKEFSAAGNSSGAERSDTELRRVLISDAVRGGRAERGAVIYEQLQCHMCHGGGAAPGREGRIFGPDLAGVTRRLTREELADGLIYPSKVVAERFKASELELENGNVVVGFITEQNNEFVTLAERDQARRYARTEVVRLSPQSSSLMPDRLLGHLTDEEVRDLMAFLEQMGAAGK